MEDPAKPDAYLALGSGLDEGRKLFHKLLDCNTLGELPLEGTHGGLQPAGSGLVLGRGAAMPQADHYPVQMIVPEGPFYILVPIPSLEHETRIPAIDTAPKITVAQPQAGGRSVPHKQGVGRAAQGPQVCTMLLSFSEPLCDEGPEAGHRLETRGAAKAGSHRGVLTQLEHLPNIVIHTHESGSIRKGHRNTIALLCQTQHPHNDLVVVLWGQLRSVELLLTI
mmetsp:Transcript_37268/g.89626  ORF Transcript_37268/g.89626 Transcript_37268/m.89626 type:complete len:223 (-) Transcript_37268:1743-2411(-)